MKKIKTLLLCLALGTLAIQVQGSDNPHQKVKKTQGPMAELAQKQASRPIGKVALTDAQKQKLKTEFMKSRSSRNLKQGIPSAARLNQPIPPSAL